jgi:DNA-binding CsgD family transcriptional regulator
MEKSFVDLLDALDGACDPGECWHIGRHWLAASGVEWCMYTYTDERWEPGGRQRIRYSSLPRPWDEHYKAQAFFRIDPAIAHCAQAVTPMLTGVEPPPRRATLEWRLWEDSLSGGFGGGIAIPLRLPGSQLGGFSLLTGMTGAEFFRWHKDHGRWALLAAHAIDQRILTLAVLPVSRPRLSPREKECLTWLAVGLRNDRVAEKLSISRPTVELHLRNARRKLNARTREQALARAVALGLLAL